MKNAVQRFFPCCRSCFAREVSRWLDVMRNRRKCWWRLVRLWYRVRFRPCLRRENICSTTDRSLDKLANDFGAPFLAALDDICETGEFSQDSLREIAGRMLKLFCERTEKQLRFTLLMTRRRLKLLQHLSSRQGDSCHGRIRMLFTVPQRV